MTKGEDSLRAWNVETGKIVASSGGASVMQRLRGRRVLVVPSNRATTMKSDSTTWPTRTGYATCSRNMVNVTLGFARWRTGAASDQGGLVRLFDPSKGELIASLHGHLNAAHSVAFAPDGRRLISACSGREAVKLWMSARGRTPDLGGNGAILSAARWSADGT